MNAPQQVDFQPWSLESEQSLLGWMLVDQRFIAAISSEVRVNQFYDALHGALAELAYDLDRQDKAVTPLTLHNWAKHLPHYTEAGAQGFLANLALAAPALTGKPETDDRLVRNVARHVADMALRREAEDAIIDASERLRRGDPTTDSLVNIVKVSDALQAEQELKTGAHDAGESGYEMLRAIETQAVAERPFACPTGIQVLDDLIGGLMPSNLYIVGGRPGMGKSVLATTFARAAAQAGWAADIYSLEMSAREVSARLQCDLDYDRLMAGEKLRPLQFSRLLKMTALQDEVVRAAHANQLLRELDIKIFDHGSMSMGRISGTARARVAASAKPKLNIIDHLGLIDPDDRYKGRKVDELSDITKGAKQLAKRTNTPVVLLCQLSRGLEAREDKRPFMSDFRDSGSIEQDADVLITLYRHAYYAAHALRMGMNKEQTDKAVSALVESADIMEIGIPKNRHGETKDSDPLKVHCHIASAAIRDCSPQEVLAETGAKLLLPV